MSGLVFRCILHFLSVYSCIGCCKQKEEPNEPTIPAEADYKEAALIRVNYLRALQDMPPMKLTTAAMCRSAEMEAISLRDRHYVDYLEFKNCSKSLYPCDTTDHWLEYRKVNWGDKWIENGTTGLCIVNCDAPLDTLARVGNEWLDSRASRDPGREDIYKSLCPLTPCWDYFNEDASDKRAEWTRLVLRCVDKYYAQIGAFDTTEPLGYHNCEYARNFILLMNKDADMGVGVALANVTRVKKYDKKYSTISDNNFYGLYNEYYANAVVSFFSAGIRRSGGSGGGKRFPTKRVAPQGVKDLYCQWIRQ